MREWGFINKGAKLVLKTRGHHGPARVELHDTTTGKLLETSPAFGDDLPEWAEPYREWFELPVTGTMKRHSPVGSPPHFRGM